MTVSAVTEDSVEVHFGTNSHRKTFQASGRALDVGKKECGLLGNVAFGVVNPKAMTLNHHPSITSLWVPPEDSLRSPPPTPPTPHSGPIGARTRFRNSKPPLLQ